MHIPQAMMQGTICPVTAAVSAAGIAGAAFAAVKSKFKPAAGRFAAVTALIFAAQMINFPISGGTSGHLLGGVLASALLGTPLGMLAIALVVSVQAIVFSDGGLTVLGANIFNMAIIGAGIGGMIHSALSAKNDSRIFTAASAGIAAWISVVAASFAVSVELSISGTIPFSTVVTAMLSTHALIGIGEGLITAAAVYALASKPAEESVRGGISIPLTAAVVLGLMISPFASPLPDGLEWVAQKYSFLHESAPAFAAVMPDYTIPVISSEMISTGLAGLAGVAICFGLAWLMGQAFSARARS